MNEIHRLKTIHHGHEDIDDKQVERTVPEQGETLAAVVGYDNIVSMTFKQHLDGRQDRAIIIDHENVCHASPSAIRRLTSGCMLVQFAIEHKLYYAVFLQGSASGIEESLLSNCSGEIASCTVQPVMSIKLPRKSGGFG